jgi:hypothetical protein
MLFLVQASGLVEPAPKSEISAPDPPFCLELAGRYVVGAQLTRIGTVRTFNATDLWLDRRVALAIDGMDRKNSLSTIGRLAARISSPHVVDVIACGDDGTQSFVVFERPIFTLAFLAREAALYRWDDPQAVAAARELVVGLSDLHRAGVATEELDLGSIGIDGIGRVRVSPWPLGYEASKANDSWESTGDMALVATVLETGLRGDGYVEASPAREFAARLRRNIGRGVTPSYAQLSEALSSLESAALAPGEPTAEISIAKPAVSAFSARVPHHAPVPHGREFRAG